MHKPVRPKSAKGQTRRTHPAIDRSTDVKEKSSSTSGTTSVFTQSPGPGASSLAYQNSSTSRSLQTKHHNNTSRNHSGQEDRGSFINSTQIFEDPASTSQDTDEADVRIQFPEITRPTSSLSRYHILPSISPHPHSSGSPSLNKSPGLSDNTVGNEVDLLTEKAQQMILDSARQRMNRRPTPPNGTTNKRKVTKAPTNDHGSKRPKVYQTQSVFVPSGSTHADRKPEKPRMPREPNRGEESLLIALKLPDGQRVERAFIPQTKISGLLVYAHSQYPIIPISQCNVFRMDCIPKKLIADCDKTLQELGIVNRTVLYIEENEDL